MSSALSELERFNPWWRGALPCLPDPIVERELFHTIRTGFGKHGVQTIHGLRQVGKTTLMYQLISELLETTAPERILYFSFDLYTGTGGSFKTIMETYLTHVLKTPVMYIDAPVYVFLDEVHRLPEWSREVKYYADLQPQLRFVITGSSSMRLTYGTGESLIGRTALHELHPFTFHEYLAYRGIAAPPAFDLLGLLSDEEAQIPELPDSERLKIEFNRYVEYGGLPGLYSMDDALERRKEIKVRTDLALFRDILEVFDIRQPARLSALFHFIVSNSAQVINYTSVTNALGIKYETLKQYLEYLEFSHLIHRVTRYSSNPLKMISKNPKLFVSDHSFFQLNGCDEGRIMETIAYNHLFRLAQRRWTTVPQYWSGGKGEEVDMVVRTGEGMVVPFEMKYRSSISRSDMKGLRQFAGEFEVEIAFLVTVDDEGIAAGGKERTAAPRLVRLPLWKFLLSG